MQLLLVVAAVLLPLVLNVVALRRLWHLTAADEPAPWRKMLAYLGLATNLLAYAIPWALFLYMDIVRPTSPDKMFDGVLVVNIALALATLSFISGGMGPKQVRSYQMLSALIVGFFWLSIPMGIL
jgi:hypothetical protein